MVVTDVSTTWAEVIIRVKPEPESLDSDDEFPSDFQNISHHHWQQSFSGLHSPEWSYYTIRVSILQLQLFYSQDMSFFENESFLKYTMRWLKVLSIWQPYLLIIHQVIHISDLLSFPGVHPFSNPPASWPTAAVWHLLTAGTSVKKAMH